MTCPFPMRLSSADFKAIRAKAKARRLQRIDRIADNLALSGRKASQAAQDATGRTKRRYKRQNARKSLIQALDTEFSLFIRIRDKSVRGGKCVFDWCNNPIECCFHVITRSKHSVRWDFRNAVGSCMIDNYKMEFNPHPYITWYIKKYGIENYESLVASSNRIAKFSIGDLEEIRKAIARSFASGFPVHKENQAI